MMQRVHSTYTKGPAELPPVGFGSKRDKVNNRHG